MARWNKKWTEATVVAGLKAFYGRPGNTPGSPAPESLEVANPPLIGGARRVFGSLKAAMEAADLPYPPHPPSPWNESTLLSALRKMHAEGRDLSLSAVKDRHAGSLLGPALHRFGSWRKAVEAAGINYAEVARVREWTRESVLRELERRRDEGMDMGGGAIQKQDLKLWAAAKRHFGTYQDALKAVGVSVEPPPVEWTWSIARLRRELRDVHRTGTDLSSGSIRDTRPALLHASRSRFGSWRKAIESAGLNYQEIRRAREWSKQAIVERLRELHKAGMELRAGVIQETDIPLSGAVQRYFGTLRNALQAANLPVPPDRSQSLAHWTDESVLTALQDLNARGVDLRYRVMKQKRQALFYAAKKLFGSYTNAVAEAGIDYWQMSQSHRKAERDEAKKIAYADGQLNDND